ncbi:MAG: hypothetical protein R3321_12870, partial [Nitrososphaeraceae archaeon]|nr:hypothetical protein [Nitrososphaeraceae archaeon]
TTPKFVHGAFKFVVKNEEEPDRISELYSKETIEKIWMPSFGIHIGRQFQFYKGLYVPVRINYQYGIRNAFKQSFHYTTYNLSDYVYGDGFIKGTSYSFEIGVGYTFNKKAEQ